MFYNPDQKIRKYLSDEPLCNHSIDWLERRKECGNPCQKCAKKCTMQAIHPDGRINKNECLFCMHCQVIMHDNFQCPPLINKRKKLKNL